MSDAPEMYVTTTEEIQREVGLLTQAIAARDVRIAALKEQLDESQWFVHRFNHSGNNRETCTAVSCVTTRALLAEEEHMHTQEAR